MSFWTDERTGRLRELWAAGLSCSQIRDEMGAPSRNAVIGKVHRLGLPERKPRRDKGVRRAAGKRKLPWLPGPQIAPALTGDAPQPCVEAIMEQPVSQPVSLLELRAHHCRWPLWGPERREGLYCGGAAVEGLPYCWCHAAIAFAPSQPRRPAEQRRAA